MSNESDSKRLRQERDQVPFKRLLLVAIGLNTVGALLVTWSWLTLRAREVALRPSRAFPEQSLGPRREVSGVEQGLFGERGAGQELTARKHAELDRYRWVDAKKRTVQIPVEAAMDLVVRQSNPPPAPPAPSEGP